MRAYMRATVPTVEVGVPPPLLADELQRGSTLVGTITGYATGEDEGEDDSTTA